MQATKDRVQRQEELTRSPYTDETYRNRPRVVQPFRLHTAQRRQRAVPLLFMDVNLGAGKSARGACGVAVP